MAAAKSLNEALLAVQKNAPKIQKDKINKAFGAGSKYASTDSILADILPLLNETGLVLTQSPSTVGVTDPQPALRSRITHVATGDYIEDVMLLMLDKQNAQGLGGAITYGRRYAVTSMLGLVTEADDDGNSASTREVARPRRTTGTAGVGAGNSSANEEW